MKSVKFEIVIGITPGYENVKSKTNKNEGYLCGIWQILAENEFKKSNMFISSVIRKGRVSYHHDWGCPVRGEEVYIISGEQNPEFIKDSKLYKQSVLNIANNIKDYLRQETITCSFSEVDFNYITTK